MNLQSLNTRETTGPVTLADGVILPVYVGGDYFYIYALTGTLQVSVNDGSFGPCLAGLIHRGVAGRDDLGLIRFRNSSGAPATITVVHGKGSMDMVGQASINNLPAEYPLPAAQVAALLAGLNPVALDAATLTALEPPPQNTLTPDFYDVITDDVVLANKLSVILENVGGAPATITIGGGVPRTLASGRSVSFSVMRHQDKLASIEIDAAGTTVQVTELS